MFSRLAWLGAALLLFFAAGCGDALGIKDLTSAPDDATTALAPDGAATGDDATADSPGDQSVGSDSGDAAACSTCGGSKCVDFSTDAMHCGACGTACVANEVCRAGKCACNGTGMLCGTGAAAACHDLMVDPANCGACGNECLPTQACEGGQCICPGAETQCPPPPAPGTCVNETNDPLNCGACGKVCAAGASCQNGVCACPGTETRCGMGSSAACVDMTTDHDNCGVCGNNCGRDATCEAGKCVLCPAIPGGLECGTPTVCVDPITDRHNCGKCANPCLQTQLCKGAACVCPANETLCGSGTSQACVLLASDQQNCGKCGNQCTGGKTCTSSLCVCPAGQHDCNGICYADTSTSTSKCGLACDACPTPDNGAPTCSGTPLTCGLSCPTPPFRTLCGKGNSAACVDMSTDVTNCAACGNACSTNNATEKCVNSACVLAACTPGFLDCDRKAANGCETNGNIDTSNCGACSKACSQKGGVASCANGHCSIVCIDPSADCNHNPADGCEVDTDTDNANCGACGHACPTGSNCSNGVCGSCNPGEIVCGTKCVPCPSKPANGRLACSNGACVAACNNASFPLLCSGVCVNPKTDNGNCGVCGTACNLSTSANKCDQTFACVGGACVDSNPIGCPPASNSCEGAPACDARTGVCGAETPLTGTPCTGSDKCNQTYTCQAGSCTGSNPKVCPAPADLCHEPGTCNPATGSCSAPTPKADGIDCSAMETDRCKTWTCQKGVCTGSASKQCVAQDECHAAGVCDPATGTCSNPTANENVACHSGTVRCFTYTCQGGSCKPAGSGCTPIDQCHGAGVCDATSQTCSTPVAPGKSCMTTADQCSASVAGTCDSQGNCVGPMECQPNACQSGGTCTSMGCTFTPKTCPAGDNCGTITVPGCATPIQCGTCTGGQSCGGGNPGTPNVCGCTKATSCSGGQSCGTQSDNCSGMVNCGTCPAGQTCNSGQCCPTACPAGQNCGTLAVPVGCPAVPCTPGCQPGQTCGGGNPGTPNVCGCTPQGKAAACGTQTCGSASDGCGGMVACGTCTGNQMCDGTGHCMACPTTCPSGMQCGTAPDGCGHTLMCGTCPAGSTCNGSNQCVCQPLTSCPAADNCGAIPDGCGGTVSCGPACAGAGQTCGGAGTPNVCGCTPQSKAVACGTQNCGSASDGCGGTVTCGTCTPPQTCGGGNPGTPNVCGCTALSKAMACGTQNCGTAPDGCGAMVACGTCTPPQTCGGGNPGTPNMCGCTPLTACPAGQNCGTSPDGCGGAVICGTCTLPLVCNVVVNMCQ